MRIPPGSLKENNNQTALHIQLLLSVSLSFRVTFFQLVDTDFTSGAQTQAVYYSRYLSIYLMICSSSPSLPLLALRINSTTSTNNKTCVSLTVSHIVTDCCLYACFLNVHQQSVSGKLIKPNWTDRQTHRQTDRQTDA